MKIMIVELMDLFIYYFLEFDRISTFTLPHYNPKIAIVVIRPLNEDIWSSSRFWGRNSSLDSRILS